MKNPVSPESTHLAGERRLSGAIILGVPIVLVIITFLFWYQTWFGRKLSDAEMTEYLQDTSVPHKTQHALTQMAAEIMQHDPAAKRFYSQVVAMAGNKEAGLRSMAAWVMGQDNDSTEFHQALSKLVGDKDLMVRWNAALALARFGDGAGDAELREMLLPYDLPSPVAGTIAYSVRASDHLRNGGTVARVKGSSPDPMDIHSPLAGTVERLVQSEGMAIAVGDKVAVISPDDQQLWEALRALYLVGGPNDLEAIDKFARLKASVSARVQTQAALTADAIRKRAAKLTIEPAVGSGEPEGGGSHN